MNHHLTGHPDIACPVVGGLSTVWAVATADGAYRWAMAALALGNLLVGAWACWQRHAEARARRPHPRRR